tara:strand:+ start:183 stop:320 length:138 start_codon:yes stop_codon:yes gene_type:complete
MKKSYEYSNPSLALDVLSDLQDRIMEKYREENKKLKVKKKKVKVK